MCICHVYFLKYTWLNFFFFFLSQKKKKKKNNSTMCISDISKLDISGMYLLCMVIKKNDKNKWDNLQLNNIPPTWQFGHMCGCLSELSEDLGSLPHWQIMHCVVFSFAWEEAICNCLNNYNMTDMEAFWVQHQEWLQAHSDRRYRAINTQVIIKETDI